MFAHSRGRDTGAGAQHISPEGCFQLRKMRVYAYQRKGHSSAQNLHRFAPNVDMRWTYRMAESCASTGAPLCVMPHSHCKGYCNDESASHSSPAFAPSPRRQPCPPTWCARCKKNLILTTRQFECPYCFKTYYVAHRLPEEHRCGVTLAPHRPPTPAPPAQELPTASKPRRDAAAGGATRRTVEAQVAAPSAAQAPKVGLQKRAREEEEEEAQAPLAQPPRSSQVVEPQPQPEPERRAAKKQRREEGKGQPMRCGGCASGEPLPPMRAVCTQCHSSRRCSGCKPLCEHSHVASVEITVV